MPQRKKYGKNIKYKRKMKGGNIEKPVFATPITKAQADKLPLADAVPVKPAQGGSSYNKYNDKIYIGFVTGIAIMGVVWFMISRTLIKHKYSEVVSYSLLGAGVLFSLLLVGFKAIRISGDSSTNKAAESINRAIFIFLYVLRRSVPGLLILAQIGTLIWLMKKHADFLWDTDPEDLPDKFNTFNSICIFMILGQCWVWRNNVLKIMTNVTRYKNPMIVPGFILAAILSGIAISQLYIILEHLKTDC